jgi:hypothetical protein
MLFLEIAVFWDTYGIAANDETTEENHGAVRVPQALHNI